MANIEDIERITKAAAATPTDREWLAEAAQRIREEYRRAMDDMAAQWLRPICDPVQN
jgi:hypothetical protein